MLHTNPTKRIVASVCLICAVVGNLIPGRAQTTNPKIDPKQYTIEPEFDVEAVRTLNGWVRVRWVYDAESITVYRGYSPTQIEHAHPVSTVLKSKETSFLYKSSNQREYYEVKFRGGAMNGKSIVVAERFLRMEGAFNFRDIGGYRTESGKRVRLGLVYRSEDLSRLTDYDNALLTQGLKLNTLFDFRDSTEIKAKPDHLPAQSPLTCVNLPISATGSVMRQVLAPLLKGDQKAIQDAMSQSYIDMVDAHGEDVFGPLIKSLAEPKKLPALYHCTAGKDRTGIATALILTLLGVDEKTVIADYSLTNRIFDQLAAALKDNKSLTAMGLTADKMAPLIIADPLWMQRTLEHIRTKYGSVEGYLKTACKLDDATLTRVKANLVE